MSSDPLRREIESHTGPIESMAPLGGGDIADAFRIHAARGVFFLKQSSGSAGEAFEAEAVGLSALRSAAEGTGLRVPQVVFAGNRGRSPGLLLLEWIPRGREDSRYWDNFGEALAALHRKEPQGEGWGFQIDNFIGATPQRNGWMSDWPAFFRERRLRPQMELARRAKRWESRWDWMADRVFERLETLLPKAPERSLLHGDLWSGNHVAGEGGVPWLIDPAPYVGHREADYAMTELFGGFAPRFYEAYEGTWPVEAGYPERREVYNLYHLLNHLNLFGGGYAAQVDRALRQIAG